MSSFCKYATASSTNTDDTTLVAAPGALKFINITAIDFSNSHASTATTVTVKAGASVIWSGLTVPAGGSHSIHLPKAVRLPENTALVFASSGSVTTLYANVAYFLEPDGTT